MEPALKKPKTERLQCNYYNPQKSRQCGMTRRADAEYCSEHINLLKKQEGGAVHAGSIQGGRERVPCPLDPHHTVWKDQLKRHVKKCNTNKLAHANDGQVFYSCDMNRGDAIETEKVDYQECIGDAVKLLQELRDSPELSAVEIPLSQKCNEHMQNSRINELHNQKHAIQQSSLIQNMLDCDVLNPLSPTQDYLEFGCGRAEFSRYLNQVVYTACKDEPRQITYHLVDRGSNRMKFDSKFPTDTQEITGQKKVVPAIRRVKIDIKDLKMDTQLSPERTYVALSKHLCGVATDLTLRCIVNNPVFKQKLDGLCIAMCCRHVCDPRDYVNAEFIKSLIAGKTALSYFQFFTCLTKMCSWATSGRRPGMGDSDVVQISDNVSMTVEEREELGLLARKIIDTGRYNWVKKHLGEDVRLVRYVDKDISLENVALILRTSR